MVRAALLLAALLAFAGPAAADVVSKAPDAVEVTIYRDGPMNSSRLRMAGRSDAQGLALITETRTVDLPAGATKVRFEGVADGIIPQSASVEGLPAGAAERNFDYDLLTPGALVAHSIGQTVTIIRTDARTGKQTQEQALIRSGPDGVVLQGPHGAEALHCSGGAERLVFDHAPEGLADRPTLSVVTHPGAAGRYKLRISYLSVRLDWSADYVARLNPDGKTLDLAGWITLANRSSASFTNAPTAVVAGNVARTAVNLPRPVIQPLFPNCWPMETTSTWYPPPPPPMPPISVTAYASVPAPMMMQARGAMAGYDAMAKPRAIESALGDYKLYTLAEPTTVAAQQTKQVLFLHQAAVKYETVYTHMTYGWPLAGPVGPRVDPTQVVFRLQNKLTEGLGRALPAGQVSVRQRQAVAGGREMFLGQHDIRDVPVGEPFEVAMGEARDVTVQARVVSDTRVDKTHVRRALEFVVANAKSTPVTVELRHGRGGIGGFRIVAESQAHEEKAGDPVWRVPLATGGEATVSYTVELER